MNRKTFTLASFLTALGILFLGSFYAWVISQFNETKFLTKFNHYFSKNFPNYSIEVSDIKLKISNKLSYRMSNLIIKEKKSGDEILKAPYLVLDIPVGAFLGDREIRLKTKDMRVHYKNSKSFKKVFFSNNREKQTVQLDLPKLIDRNKFSLKADNFSVNFLDTGYTKNFKKIFFKNLNMSHYTAFEVDGELREGTYRLYGEVDLGNFLKSKNIKMEAYLTFRDFPDHNNYLNDLMFKVVTVPSTSAYSFKLTGLSNNAKGDIKFLADSTKLKVNLENFITTEKIIKDQLWIDRYYNCEKSGNANVEGVLTYYYEVDLWDPDYSVLGDCVQVTHTLKKRDPILYAWDVKFIEEQGIEINIEANDFFMDKNSLQRVQFTRNYLDYNKQSSLDNFLVKINNLYETTTDLDQLNFPIDINVKQVDVDKKYYSLRASGVASRDGLTFEEITLKSKNGSHVKGSLVYSHPEKQTSYSFSLRNTPARILESFLTTPAMNIRGLVTKGRITKKIEKDKSSTAFDLKLKNGDLEWLNFISLINDQVVDQKIKASERLLWTKEYSRLNILGTQIDQEIEVDWKFVPKLKNYYSRSGQLRKLNGSSFYNLGIMFDKKPQSIKKYLMNKFGSDEVTLRLEKQEEFRVVQ